MKKKIEAELRKIAEKILNDSGKMNVRQLKENTRELYEKLSILAFTEKHLDEKSKQAPVAEKKQEPVHAYQYDEFAPDGTEFNESSDAITEPNTEKIKDIVAQMPPESQRVDSIINKMNAGQEKPEPPKRTSEKEKDFRNIGVDYDNLPNFEPITDSPQNNKPKSLNDRLKKGINIGLNERLAYIRHLFAGNTADYNRVLSQLNTFSNLEEAKKFIEKVVKPDYKHWEGKEEYEERFMAQIENKFNK